MCGVRLNPKNLPIAPKKKKKQKKRWIFRGRRREETTVRVGSLPATIPILDSFQVEETIEPDWSGDIINNSMEVRTGSINEVIYQENTMDNNTVSFPNTKTFNREYDFQALLNYFKALEEATQPSLLKPSIVESPETNIHGLERNEEPIESCTDNTEEVRTSISLERFVLNSIIEPNNSVVNPKSSEKYTVNPIEIPNRLYSFDSLINKWSNK